jgi:molecular chaperone GrpE
VSETQEAVRYASADLIKALLPVVDDLERSLAAARSDAAGSFADGVKLVHQNLLKALEAHHVERIESLGRPFDPALHEAIMRQPSDQHPPGTVLEEYQSGYRLWERVLRHAKVIVSASARPQDNKPQEQAQATPADTSEGKD